MGTINFDRVRPAGLLDLSVIPELNSCGSTPVWRRGRHGLTGLAKTSLLNSAAVLPRWFPLSSPNLWQLMTEHLPEEAMRRLRALCDETAGSTGNLIYDAIAMVTSVLIAFLQGNAAIGALLAGPDGEIIVNERNRMIVPYFRSNYHAEMDLVNRYEWEHRGDADLRGHTLVTLLEAI